MQNIKAEWAGLKKAILITKLESSLREAFDAEAKALLLAPVSYQKLTGEEAFSLYQTVAQSVSVSLCVYENPGTAAMNITHKALNGMNDESARYKISQVLHRLKLV